MTTQIDFQCAECDAHTQVEYGNEVENEDGNLVCGDCDEESWEDLDFPIWLSYQFYHDNYELGYAVSHQTGIELEEIPYARDLKYCCPLLWFKIEEHGIEGPYDEKGGELI